MSVHIKKWTSAQAKKRSSADLQADKLEADFWAEYEASLLHPVLSSADQLSLAIRAEHEASLSHPVLSSADELSLAIRAEHEASLSHPVLSSADELSLAIRAEHEASLSHPVLSSADQLSLAIRAEHEASLSPKSQRVTIEGNIVAAWHYPNRVVLRIIVGTETQNAVCWSEKPLSLHPGQKIRGTGILGEYNDRPQTKFFPDDIKILAEPVANPDLVVINKATITYIRSGDKAFKKFVTSNPEWPRAGGYIDLEIRQGQDVLFYGFPSIGRDGRPELLIAHIEEIPPTYSDGRKRVFLSRKIPTKYYECLADKLGEQFEKHITPQIIDAALSKITPTMRVRIEEACVALCNQTDFTAALRICNVTAPVIAYLIDKYPDGLTRHSPYDMVDSTPQSQDQDFDERGSKRRPRRGLTWNQADDLARSPYGKSLFQFDLQNLKRVAAIAEDAACVLIDRRGDIGASVQSLAGELRKQHAIVQGVAPKAVSLLVDKPAFLHDPRWSDIIWLRHEFAAEQYIAESIRARVGVNLRARRLSRNVTLSPYTRERREIYLNDGQIAAAEMASRNAFSMITGAPGTGKTSVLTKLVEHGGDRVMIVALAAAAARRAGEVTGCGSAITIASLFAKLEGRRNPLRDIDTLIVDEASMISSRQLAALLRVCNEAGVPRIVLVGDPDQLPPIENGQPFADLIGSGKPSTSSGPQVPTATLTEILRSAEGSGVQAIVKDIRTGAFAKALPAFSNYGSSVEFHNLRAEPVEALTAAKEPGAVAEKYLEFAREFGETKVIALSPFKARDDGLGVHDINTALRLKLGFDGPAPRVGEILMCTKNDPSTLRQARGSGREPGAPSTSSGQAFRLLNGMRLVVEHFDGKRIALRHAEGDDRTTVDYAPHARGPAFSIVWGRAATVHKYQGSEAAAVVVVIPAGAVKIVGGEPLIFDVANFYTAVSRAKKRVAIMGALDQLPALFKASSRQRITALQGLI